MRGQIVRLIPAWAGKTRPSSRRRTAPTAHPRVGGENDDRECHCEGGGGSSPRGRGKPRGLEDDDTGLRLIPAWAGKTYERKTGQPITAAHPRVGGENRVFRVTVIGLSGSSPRGRGKRSGVSRSRLMRGLIPAWAGKTCA